MPPQYPNIPRSARAPEAPISAGTIRAAGAGGGVRGMQPEVGPPAGLRGGGDGSDRQGNPTHYMTHEQLVAEYANKQCNLYYAPTMPRDGWKKDDLAYL